MHTMHMWNSGAQNLTVPFFLYSCVVVATFSVGRRVENNEAAIDSIKSCRLNRPSFNSVCVHECELMSGISVS